MLQGETVEKGWKVIEKNLEKLEPSVAVSTREKIERIKPGEGSLFLEMRTGRLGEWETGVNGRLGDWENGRMGE